MTTKIFGQKPKGERLARIKASQNYRNGEFQNLSYTPPFAENYTILGVMYDSLFKKSKRTKPKNTIPSEKTDLHQLDPNQNILVWFGHSSYYIQIAGLRILVDPVFSENASPIPNTVKAFKGSNAYSVADIPALDYLFITHDHYDHLDYKTITALQSKVKQVVCGLGVGAHFEYWGYDPSIILEKDWYESIVLNTKCTLHITPSRHFSGRMVKRNQSLWISFVLHSPSLNLFLGGDSGYDKHYAIIGEKYGPFDLAILENGQYNDAWPYLHQKPEELLIAAKDLKTKQIFPVHSSKFTLSAHAWDEPLAKLSELNKDYNFPIKTPMIGELVYLANESQEFKQWWLGLH